ncbi:MAG: GNAT family N-acetyltransferase [Alphaproteobacteria bacterium]|nr:GNAT family N-acetyltransferase [Alphaproteobacteria bacterium]MCW5743553.1 GNAT family N-acetyltransferase [Alphaproteobacteria bacterium]
MSRPKFPMLETERLRLRRFRLGDIDAMHAAFGSARAMRYWTTLPLKTRAETAKRVRGMMKIDVQDQWLRWAIARRRDDACLGMINYYARNEGSRRLELGWILAPRHEGKGYAREATQAVIRYCIDVLGTHRIEAMIMPENTASIRLAEAVGFKLEGGPLRDRWRRGEEYRSVMVYGLLAGEER